MNDELGRRPLRLRDLSGGQRHDLGASGSVDKAMHRQCIRCCRRTGVGAKSHAFAGVGAVCTQRGVMTGDTALRLGHWFGTDPAFWLNLQSQYDLAVAAEANGEAVRRLPTNQGVVQG